MEPQGWAGSAAQKRRAGFEHRDWALIPRPATFALCVTGTAWPTSLTLGFLLLKDG